MQQEDKTNLNDLIIGKWEYQTSILETGGEEQEFDLGLDWRMEYHKDNTYYEVQVLGDKEYDASNTFEIEGDLLKRKGLINVKIVALNDKNLIIESSTKIVFKKASKNNTSQNKTS